MNEDEWMNELEYKVKLYDRLMTSIQPCNHASIHCVVLEDCGKK